MPQPSAYDWYWDKVSPALEPQAAVFIEPLACSIHAVQRGDLFPYRLGDQCMALSMHLFTLSTQVRGVSEELQYGTAAVLIALVLLVNSLSIGLRTYLRSRKRW